MSRFTLTDSHGHFVSIDPELDYVSETVHSQTDVRARSGTLYNYVWGDGYKKFKIPVAYVDSEFKTTVNLWHSDNERLVVSETVSYFVSDVATFQVNCCYAYITNKVSPIVENIAPYDDQFKGSIELEEGEL